MRLSGKYRLIVTGNTDKLGVGYDHKAIGYLMGRLLTGEEAVMENLANLGITVRVVEGGSCGGDRGGPILTAAARLADICCGGAVATCLSRRVATKWFVPPVFQHTPPQPRNTTEAGLNCKGNRGSAHPSLW